MSDHVSTRFACCVVFAEGVVFNLVDGGGIVKRAILITILLMSAIWSTAYAKVTDDEAIHAILGEALHDEESLKYMAHALKNRIAIRGDLKGVYGTKADIGQWSDKLWQKASKAWFSAHLDSDVTDGATHWLSDYDLKHCRPERMAWRFKMIKTVYQGQTHYFKEIK